MKEGQIVHIIIVNKVLEVEINLFKEIDMKEVHNILEILEIHVIPATLVIHQTEKNSPQ